MRVVVLASGSRGNATLVQVGRSCLLIDAGIGVGLLRRRAEAIFGAAAPTPQAILITHSHGDHAGKAEPLARALGVPIYLSEATQRALDLPPELPTRRLELDRELRLGALRIHPLAVPHDAPQVALVLRSEDRSAALVTDLGEPTDALIAHIEGVDLLLLESNHEPSLLAAGPYPPFLKRRIASRLGHLSNPQACQILKSLRESPSGAPREVVLMHLSEQCNSPELALRRARLALPASTALRVAEQDRPLDLKVERGAPRRARAEQLALPW